MESELSRVVDALPGFVWTALPDGQIDFLNRRWCEYTGLEVDRSHGPGWQAAIHPEDLPGLLTGWQVSPSGAPVETEARVRGADGHYRWFQFRAHPSADASGQVVKWCGLSTDIDHRKQSEETLRASERRFEALLAGEKQLLEMVASGRPMSEILAALCRLVESTASGCYCSIVLVDPSGTKLQEAIAPSLATEFNDAVRGWLLDRLGGPCVMAARDKVQVIMSDVVSDTRWRNGWRALAQAHGLRSCWSTPVVSLAGQVLGTFALYQCEPGSPSPHQLELISQFTNIASITIERAQRDTALKLSEARLAAVERDLRLMIDTIPVFVAAYEPDGTRSFVNRTWQDYMGLTLEGATGTDAKIFPHFHPDDVERNDTAWHASLTSGEPLSIEVRVRRADGQYRWHTSRRVPLRDEKGDIVRWYSVGIDIEDQKRAEEALLESEAQLKEAERDLKLIIDTIPAVAWSARVDGSAEFFNQKYLDYVGLSLAQAQGWGWTVAVHPDDLGSLASTWQAILASGARGEAEARLRRHDGEYRWFLFRAEPVRDQAGNVVKWYGVNTDIEDRKQAEDALRRSETLLAEGQRLSLTGTFSWRVDSNRITFSQELYRIFEFEPGTFLTLGRLRERTHPEDRALMDEKVSAVRAGHDTPEYEIRLQMPDGRTKYVRIIGRLIRRQDGRLECLGAIQDVTQGRNAEAALDKVRSELAHVTRVMTLGALTASIAHEVNQPLAGIITNASTCLRMLAADPPNVDGARETARRTIRDGNRAADVIARLRALFGRKAAATETVDLNEATREVLSLVFSDVLRNSVTLRVELDEDPLLVTGDRVQLQQVILNLVRNASDAMSGVNDRPRHLLVKADKEDGGARLSVKDTGVGLESQAIEKLFDAFYSTKSGGMGIGLSVSRSIIESHGGKLWAEPNNGPGATFSFSIPRQATSVGGEGTPGAILTRPTTNAHDVMRNP